MSNSLKKNAEKRFGVAAAVLAVTMAIVIAASCRLDAAAYSDDYAFRYLPINFTEITSFEFALELGYFEAEGVKVVELEGEAGGGANVITSLAAGVADIGNAAPPAEINAIAAGAPIKIIYGGPAVAHEKYPGIQLLLRSDSEISSVDDLRGKTIAVSSFGAMNEYFVRIALAKAGVSKSEVTLLRVPMSQHSQVLESNQVDAASTGSPIADYIIEHGIGKRLTDLYHALGDDLAGNGWGYFINTDVLAKHPEGAKKLVSALVKSDEWVEANPNEARKIVRKIFEKRGQNPDLANYWFPIKLVNHGFWEDKNIRFWIDFLIDDKKIKEGQVKPSDIYTNEYNPYYGK
ncbi:MAG: ABC transporter substrate-binding protein [Synergistaceae bacterium]|jgi:ABC-type nitrate/sulfonate/bicarbonate transport system substrate-binding protein|nr:ABC transporter substrate-binding protein [Synergistaceae bacterium]